MKSVEELRALCVTDFAQSTVRADLMAGFESIYDRAVAIQLTGKIWIDGSFLTQKIDPGDVDFIFLVEARIYDSGPPDQREFIEWLISNEDDPKKDFFCHTDVVLMYPQGSSLRHLTETNMKHWEEKVYGYSVTSHEPKGIVVVELQAPKAVPVEVPK